MIKVGGSLGDDMSRACADIAALVGQGSSVVVVHGGGAESDRVARELGRPPRYLTARDGRRSRYTDAAALDALTLGMLGRVKPPLVVELLRLGVRAVGLSGVDGGLVTARRTPPARVVLDGEPRVVRDDLSGRITSVDPHLVRTLLAGGYTPVVSPPALDPEVGPLNVDADRFAARLAVALDADWLIVLSNVPGLLRDPDDPSSLVAEVPCDDLTAHLELAGGRMKVKLRSAGEARLAGVPHVVLADGRGPSPVLAARAGTGTTFVGGAA
ncbi:[LysW]-aminoadipate kinase [Saccharothrix syringae]|uniref:[LysW]-aminoadipate kinase n=1 Tax=Saccharothrix syringae TaxID=103733 RepID=A0A5Q0H4T5_SACSY|nr:[LysW]-aminoadipate kinase [Saccharothrix syringae]QFZ21159.1 [LysW]-aminoadipate kinase [Saccharothrix syringae]